MLRDDAGRAEQTTERLESRRMRLAGAITRSVDLSKRKLEAARERLRGSLDDIRSGAWMLVLIAFVAEVITQKFGTRAENAAAGVAGGLLFGALAIELITRRLKRTIKSVGDTVQRSAEEQPGSAEEIRTRLRVSGVGTGREDLVRQFVDRYVTDESVLLEQAESELLRFLPPLPRSIKRMLNHLRVLLVVADGRGMFGGDPPVERAHLWKWAVLEQRWPELARRIARDPHELDRLEHSIDLQALQSLLVANGSTRTPSQDLLDFLQAPPQLGAIVRRLVRYERAEPQPGNATIIRTESGTT